MNKRFVERAGGTMLGVWLIKHVVAPLDRAAYRLTNGHFVAFGRPMAPTLLLTTVGRRSGRARTTPVFYFRDGDKLIICNVNPGFEKPNPWTLNVRANPIVEAQVGALRGKYTVYELQDVEIERYWPALVQLWPAYQQHYERSGSRSVFVLAPL